KRQTQCSVCRTVIYTCSGKSARHVAYCHLPHRQTRIQNFQGPCPSCHFPHWVCCPPYYASSTKWVIPRQRRFKPKRFQSSCAVTMYSARRKPAPVKRRRLRCRYCNPCCSIKMKTGAKRSKCL